MQSIFELSSCFRLCWLAFTVTAIVLFVIQVQDRVYLYFNHNTTVSLNIHYTDQVPFPAVTLCNINTFRSVQVTHC